MSDFHLGQTVTSRAHGCTLTGTLVGAHTRLSDHLTFFTITRPGDPTEWYRRPEDCTPLEDPMTATTTTKKPRAKRAKQPPTDDVVATPSSAGSEPMEAVPLTYRVGELVAFNPSDPSLSVDPLDDPRGVVVAVAKGVHRVYHPQFPDILRTHDELESAPMQDPCGGFLEGDEVILNTEASFFNVATVLGVGDEMVLIEVGEDRRREHVAPGTLLLERRADVASAVYAVTGKTPEQWAAGASAEAAPLPLSPLPATASLQPGTLGLVEVPLHQTTRSACNVRRHYDTAAIEELAASLASQGQLENATGRWTADGQVEIVAGESRRRAQLLRVERGEIQDSHPFTVRIRELKDAEALEVSLTENMARRKMTPLEECEAMLHLEEAGRTHEDIAAVFGYKSTQPVTERVLAARNLGSEARDALDEGRISLAQAFVIARAPGTELQTTMLSSATNPYSPASAKTLAETLSRGQFLVKHATFNVEKSGLAIRKDLFDTFEPYFEDKAAALSAQVVHMEQVAAKARKGGNWAFVDTSSGNSAPYAYSGKYDGYAQEGEQGGLLLHVRSSDGKLERIEKVKLKKTAAVDASTGESVKVGKEERGLPEPAYTAAHERRAAAVRSGVLGDEKLALALTVHSLLCGGGEPGYVRLRRDVVQNVPLPALAAAAEHAVQLLPGFFEINENHPETHGIRPVGGTAPSALLDHLLTLELSDLLFLLSFKVAPAAYDWYPYSPTIAPSGLYARIAQLVDAPTRLAEAFVLDEEWLKRYPKADLIKLAVEAGLGAEIVEKAPTLKEARARILEHAERLHAEGFVPSLVRFPEVTS